MIVPCRKSRRDEIHVGVDFGVTRRVGNLARPFRRQILRVRIACVIIQRVPIHPYGQFLAETAKRDVTTCDVRVAQKREARAERLSPSFVWCGRTR